MFGAITFSTLEENSAQVQLCMVRVRDHQAWLLNAHDSLSIIKLGTYTSLESFILDALCSAKLWVEEGARRENVVTWYSAWPSLFYILLYKDWLLSILALQCTPSVAKIVFAWRKPIFSSEYAEITTGFLGKLMKTCQFFHQTSWWLSLVESGIRTL